MGINLNTFTGVCFNEPFCGPVCSSAKEEEPSNLGGRFSKSPTERERILHLRKEQLVQAARRRYLDRQSSQTSSETAAAEGLSPREVLSENH